MSDTVTPADGDDFTWTRYSPSTPEIALLPAGYRTIVAKPDLVLDVPDGPTVEIYIVIRYGDAEQDTLSKIKKALGVYDHFVD